MSESEWDGSSKGSLLGYRIFVFCIRTFGLRSSYLLLYFVAFYYFLFSWKSSKSIYSYFRKRQNYSSLKSFFSIYKSYYIFGQTLIDRLMVSSGNRNRFTYEFDGIENIKNAMKKGGGAILISAHVGNFELSEYFFDDLGEDIVSNIVTTDREKEQIKHFLEKLSLKSRLKFILIKDDMSHIYDLNAALSNNELVCITGDRYLPGSKHLEETFLGEPAYFPAGPFLLSSRMKVPVLFVYVMKEGTSHYHLYAREAQDFHRDEKALLKSYVSSVANMLDKYPYQWFNYFNFWKK
ncbi:MAG: lipid A biosynthesis acyltransferase [Brumimicrobium sp.]|nr:lipid A biosynthesis acyltransferase [Brumimicrobium sp.]